MSNVPKNKRTESKVEFLFQADVISKEIYKLSTKYYYGIFKVKKVKAGKKINGIVITEDQINRINCILAETGAEQRDIFYFDPVDAEIMKDYFHTMRESASILTHNLQIAQTIYPHSKMDYETRSLCLHKALAECLIMLTEINNIWEAFDKRISRECFNGLYNSIESEKLIIEAVIKSDKKRVEFKQFH